MPATNPVEAVQDDISQADLGFEDSEDELQLQSLRKQLEADGYIVSDDLDFTEMEALHNRLYEDDEQEQQKLQEFVASQEQLLNVLLQDVSGKQATLLPSGVNYLALQEESVFSVDDTLGREMCVAVSRWVNDALREKPDVTDAEIFDGFVATHSNFGSNIALHADLLRRYISTYVPIVRDAINRSYEAIRTNSSVRSKLARYLNRTEIANTHALVNAKSYSVIRQIYEHSDGSFETKCPRCGQMVKLDAPVFRIIAFAAEARPQKRIFVGHIGCSCGNALLFKSEEYRAMLRQYGSECFTGIDAYMNEAKTVSSGAVELITGIPVSAVREYLPILFTRVGDNAEQPAKQADVSTEAVVVDDNEFDQAVKQFYFKLKGMCSPVNSTAKTAMQSDNVIAEDLSSGQAGDTATQSNVYWTYHDTAVYVTQCLSKEYYVEHKRALFSLLASIQSNPHLANVLSSRSVWELQNAITFLTQFKDRKNPRSLQPLEISQLQFYIAVFAEQKLQGEDKLLEQASTCVGALQSKVQSLIAARNEMLDKMSKMADMFAFTKMLRMNSYRAEELQEYLSDKKAVQLFNEIADRMIIKTYAGDFFEYWRTFNLVSKNKLDKIFIVNSDTAAVKRSLSDLHDKLFLQAGSLKKLNAICDRNPQYEAAISKIHKDYINVDFYNFCKDLAVLDVSEVSTAMLDLLSDVTHHINVAEISHKSRAEVYLTDFTAEEIASCPACESLIFGRYVPIRLEGETINDYCKRFEDAARVTDYAKSRDTLQMFKEFDKYVLQLTTCSVITDAEFKSRGVSIFMDALLCECCNLGDVSDFLTTRLGISLMQQNIIKAVKPDYVSLCDTVCDYKLLHGMYLSSVYNEMGAMSLGVSSTNVFVTMTAKQISAVLDVRSSLAGIVVADARIDEDGEVQDDREDIVAELAGYYGASVEDFEEWLGVKA